MNVAQQRRLTYLFHIANGRAIRCVYCDEDDVNKLCGGHKGNENGNDHRRELLGKTRINGGGGGFEHIMAAMGWPREHLDRLQIECYNCNNAKRSSLRDVTYYEVEEFLYGLAERQAARHEPAEGEVGAAG